MTDENKTETALAAPSDIQIWRDQAKELAKRLPADRRDDVLTLDRPSPSRLAAMVDALPPAMQEKMLSLIARTRPKKQGAHGSKGTFSPVVVKLFQGTGEDDMRPPKMAPGEFYSAESRVLGDKFKIIVLLHNRGRALWPPRDSGEKNPICSSMDEKMGSKYGECAKCPLANKLTKDGGCQRHVTVWFMDEEMNNIYTLNFTKTSYGAGTSLIKIADKAENLWDNYIELSTQVRTEEGKRWYVIKSSPVVDPKNPNANKTPREGRDLFAALSRLIDADVYYPALANTYDRATESKGTVVDAPLGDTVDDATMLGNTATGDNPDFSNDV